MTGHSEKNVNTATDSILQSRLQQLLTDLQLDDAPAGGAVVVYQAGACIAQASTGMARPDMSWQPDTLAINFSTGKGVLATLVHVLASQALLDYDVPIAHYWPAFAAQGKEKITLRHVMSHQANLYSIQSIDADSDTLLNWNVMLDKVAAMPVTPPENAASYASAYSALVYGWVLGGVIEAATELSLAEALRHYLTEPLGIADSCYFGVPKSKVDQVAQLTKNFEGADEPTSQPSQRRHKPTLKADSKDTLHTYASLPSYASWQQKMLDDRNDANVENADSINGGVDRENAGDSKPMLDTAAINRLYLDTSMLNLRNYKAALIPAGTSPIDYYSDDTLQAVIPAANGVASAQALATIYAMLANGGKWRGQTLINQAIFEQLLTSKVVGLDAVMPSQMQWRLGYHKLFSVCDNQNNNQNHMIDSVYNESAKNESTKNESAISSGFGHMGYNGSVAWCDPERQLSFAFIHNFDTTMLNDVRQFALTEAVLSLVDDVL
ncbi:serine hydrolase [Psychrobacter sp. NG27]|uniref:serine hydrolase n=1 Tax=Psychrobacter sp. NG27 TaxID=2781966 RepID=UPI0018DFC6EB|nr:serine hydrolase domain-containing protein [Psychrobacter sp. NG27]MBI0425370.1 beta-lactamase family protein [Psychrobacter sp. NG27]